MAQGQTASVQLLDGGRPQRGRGRFGLGVAALVMAASVTVQGCSAPPEPAVSVSPSQPASAGAPSPQGPVSPPPVTKDVVFSSEVIDIYHAFEQGDDTEKRAICHDLNAILNKMTDAEQGTELNRISAYDSNVVVGLINECLKLS